MSIESEKIGERAFELMSPYQHVSELNYLLKRYMKRIETKAASGKIEEAIGDLETMERLIDEVIEILKEHQARKAS